MKRFESKYVHAQPVRRPLRIFASDPMLARTPGNRLTIDVRNEPLEPGPVGSRFAVIDFDGVHDCFYPPVNLNDPAILMQNGLEPTESDPRFHQQMVYAVAMRTLENFERALGRRIEFARRPYRKLRLLPHAFHGANAYYDPSLGAILFGYFQADRQDPGPNLPGQVVYTCLSHDIIVHELTHAIVDRLRRNFMEPSNPDVLAFHEGFSDIVALFQHFSFQEFLRDQIQQTRGDIHRSDLLINLARQFGYASGMNQALRSAIGKPNMKIDESVLEPHDRGSILVAAVFDAFFTTFQHQIRDLIRIATGGTGTLPEGDLHPDLVNRIATEASRTAQSVLTMCIRAFDYLPPVDVTFGDFLRALVTADYELVPLDETGLRNSMIEAFRRKAIYPDGVVSLAEESLIWTNAPPGLGKLDPEKLQLANEIAWASTAFSLDPFQEHAEEQADSGDESQYATRKSYGSFSSEIERDNKQWLAVSLHEYAQNNAQSLYLDPNLPIEVAGFHTIFRVGSGGHLLSELVAQFTQKSDDHKPMLGGVPFRGGTTIVAGTDGRVRYIIAKPLPSPDLGAEMEKNALQRFERQRDTLARLDMADPRLAYGDQAYLQQRSELRMRIASLHQGGS